MHTGHAVKILTNAIHHIRTYVVLYVCLCRLKPRCPNLAESGNDTVAGTNPDRDPEQTPGLLSALITGDKSLATRWAVSCSSVYSLYMSGSVYSQYMSGSVYSLYMSGSVYSLYMSGSVLCDCTELCNTFQSDVNIHG